MSTALVCMRACIHMYVHTCCVGEAMPGNKNDVDVRERSSAYTEVSGAMPWHLE